jgi:hypothetical protein
MAEALFLFKTPVIVKQKKKEPELLGLSALW